MAWSESGDRTYHKTDAAYMRSFDVVIAAFQVTLELHQLDVRAAISF